MGADGDDQVRPLLVGHQHGDVLAGPGSRHEGMRHSHSKQPVAARRPAIGVGMDDELGLASQSRVAGRIHVPEDHVRLEAGLQDRVGPAVDGDDHGPHVPDICPQRLQVVPVAVAPHDDQNVPVAKRSAGRRKLDAAGQQVGLLPDVGERVLDELAEGIVDPVALFLEADLQLGNAEDLPAEDLIPIQADDAIRDANEVTVAERLEGVPLAYVDERTPARARSSGPAFG